MRRSAPLLLGFAALFTASTAGAQGFSTGNVDLSTQPDRFAIALPDGTLLHPGHWWNPYGPNVLKGDRPFLGDHTYFVWTTVLDSQGIADSPSGSNPTSGAGLASTSFDKDALVLAAEIFHGETVFRPKDWSIKLSALTKAVGVAAANGGTATVQQSVAGENFLEVLLASHGKFSYDSTSLRGGVQFFNADVEGLVLNDVLPGGRLFAEYDSNRYNLNLFGGQPFDKANNSFLPTTFAANEAAASFFVGDAFKPGFNLTVVAAADDDHRTPGRTLDVGYGALASSGHLGRIVTQSAVYLAAGNDSVSGAASKSILAPLFVLDLARPSNAWNPRFTFLWAPGQSDATSSTESAFDSISDKEVFAGADGTGVLAGLGRVIKVGGNAVTLFRANSVLPTLRGANAAPNFIGPGVKLADLGTDLAVTPRLTFSLDGASFYFDQTGLLKGIDSHIGDEAIGKLTWRPALNDNAIVVLSSAVLFPGQGLIDLGNPSGAEAKGDLRLILAF